MSNPFIMPMWLMLAVAIVVSFLIDIPGRTLWGMAAYGPFLIVFGALIWWEKRHP